MRISDWSSDVCSSDLLGRIGERLPAMLADLEKVVAMAADGGLKLHPETLAAFSRSHRGRNHIWALWVARSEEHTSELQSLMRISYAVFCLKTKQKNSKYKHIFSTSIQQATPVV